LSLRLLLSCAEASGDLYAGALTRALREREADLQIAGLGGPHFQAAGGELVADYRGIAVTGLTEAVSKIPEVFAVRRRLLESARAQKPAALVVIDSPDFNFRLAPGIKRLGVPIIYYVSPQIWAWRPGRINAIRRFADLVLVIFPFEEDLYRKRQIPVEFVGHPLVDLTATTLPREAFLRGRGLSPSAPCVALLPGSRPNEVARILPVLGAAATLIRRQMPDAQFLVARAPNLDDGLFSEIATLDRTAIVERDADTVLASADMAVTASGTATVQTALHNTPMVIVYRVSPISYQLLRRLVRVDAIGMVNLIAGERIVPELVQDDFTPERVAAEAVSLLTDQDRAMRMRDGLARVRARLGPPGASGRAADAILRVARRRAHA
jgi:lipid-A-disaccharide synthase